MRLGLQADLSRGAGRGGAGASTCGPATTPPKALVNGNDEGQQGRSKEVPSVLLTPIWVTPKNMAETVVKDGFVDAAKLCAGDMAKACKAAGISS